jgi:uncharacterized coiled-coil protein SlyX
MDKKQKDIESQMRQTSEYQLAPEGKCNTQLPADMVEEIKLKAEGYATITAHIPKGVPISHHDAHVWCRNDYEAGATEYATKLHQCDKANKALEEANRGLVEKIATLEQSCNEKNMVITELNNTVTNLRGKRDRYEAALKEILKQHDYYSVIELAVKALSEGEGDKEVEK